MNPVRRPRSRAGQGPVPGTPARPALDRGDSVDRGSATVLLLAIGLVLFGAGLAGVSLAAAHLARHQAQSAADLSALAGAPYAVAGSRVACAEAAAIATANHAQLTRCDLDGLDLVVTVEVIPATVVGPGRIATATARAGPIRASR